MSKHEVDHVINEIEPRVSEVVRVLVPGEQLYLVANKTSRQLLLFDGDWRILAMYPFTGFSGTDGPKRREGDGQIPEGVYAITHLNPRSKFHLSLRLNYPNDLDAQYNGAHPGSDIYIHGSHVTIGCIPIGDAGIEDVFYAVRRVGMAQLRVVIFSESLFGKQRSAYEQAIQASVLAILPEQLRPGTAKTP